MGKVIWGLNTATSGSGHPPDALQDPPRTAETGSRRRWFDNWTTRWQSAWERRVRTGQFMSRLRSLALTVEDLAWLPRLVNMRLLIVSDQALFDTRLRQPALILLPTGESWPVDSGGVPAPVRTPTAESFYRLFLLSVRSLPLAPEACLLREHERRPAWECGERERGVAVARTGAILIPGHHGLMVTDHALLNRAGGWRRATFSLLRGNPDSILAQCQWVWQPGNSGDGHGGHGGYSGHSGQVIPLAEAQRKDIMAASGELMARGYLPVALAIWHQVGTVLGTGHPAGGVPRCGGRLWPAAEAGEGGQAAVYLGLMAFDNPLLAGVESSLEFFRSRSVSVLWDSRLPPPLQQAIIASSLNGLVMTGEPPARLTGVRPLTYAGRSPAETASVCREWEVVRVQAFPDGSGRLQPLGRRELGHYQGRSVPVPAPAAQGSLLVRLRELHRLAEQAIVMGVKSN